MDAEIKWLDDPRVFRKGVLPAHSDHAFFRSQKDAEGENGLLLSLNGQWDFAFSKNAMERPKDFYRVDFDRSGFDKITVPGHIEMAGYDKINYINVMYPWEGKIFRRPAGTTAGEAGIGSFSEAEYNPVGSYVKTFDLKEEMKGKRIRIRFEGVEQAMYVWINGEFLGYAEDTFTPSEFDLTPYIKETGNVLAVEVHKRSTAAYMEDQDFFRFFGIFRSVTVCATPELHLEDIFVHSGMKEDMKSASFRAECKVNAKGADAGKLVYELKCAKGNRVLGGELILSFEDGECKIAIPEENLDRAHPWCHKDPYLYSLEIRLMNENGEEVEFVRQQVGFNRIEIKDKVILYNGERLRITGVNRHEWNCDSGRVVSLEDMKYDINLFLENHINSVRTCHYPDTPIWYTLCDEAGIYVMAESNMETHGSWGRGKGDSSWNVPGSFPAWTELAIDRASNNFETFKNHPSILFWSLGNEAFAGDNIAKMHRFFKEKDPDRIVHYEGVVNNRAYEDQISEVESRMYERPHQICEYLDNDPKKPFLLCEYMHDMGNSLGGMKSYTDLFDKYPMYHGGYIWDYIDQGIRVEDEVTGGKTIRYGGDFDDRLSDYEFSGNGIVFADRTPKPALQEVNYYYGIYE